MKAVLARVSPHVPVIELFSDAPAADPLLGAYLLAAYAGWWPADTVFLCVIDPGVGSDRAAVILNADGRWFVGPDNGLFEITARRATAPRVWRITWKPPVLSASFHGRDLFAPVAAMIARGDSPPAEPGALTPHADWPDDLPQIVYVDHYGNAMTGLRGAVVPAGARLRAGGHVLCHTRTFSDVSPGQGFWYENANGLAEIAVNRGRADRQFGISIGTRVSVIEASQNCNPGATGHN